MANKIDRFNRTNALRGMELFTNINFNAMFLYVAIPDTTFKNQKLSKTHFCFAKNRQEMKDRGMNHRIDWERFSVEEFDKLKKQALSSGQITVTEL